LKICIIQLETINDSQNCFEKYQLLQLDAGMKSFILITSIFLSSLSYAGHIDDLSESLILFGNINFENLSDNEKVTYTLGMSKVQKVIANLSNDNGRNHGTRKLWECHFVTNRGNTMAAGIASYSYPVAQKNAFRVCNDRYLAGDCRYMFNRYDCKVIKYNK
jgi:hypothetical protein